MNELTSPWLALESLLFVGGGLTVLAATWKQEADRPFLWWPVPVAMGLLGWVVLVVRSQLLPAVVQGVPHAELAHAALRVHIANAEAGWLVLILMMAWCLAAAWSHGLHPADRTRLWIAAALLGLAGVAGNGRMGIAAVAVAAVATAPGRLGTASGLLAVAAGFLAHLGWLSDVVINGNLGGVWLAWVTAPVWGGMAVLLGWRSPHFSSFVGGLLGVGIGGWLAIAHFARAPYRPLAFSGDAPVHRPARLARSVPQAPAQVRAMGAEASLRDVGQEGPGNHKVLVAIDEGPWPPGLGRWRWSWEPLRIVQPGSRFVAPASAVKVDNRHGVLTLHNHDPLTEPTLVSALAGAPLRVDLVAKANAELTLDAWLAWCRTARKSHEFVRCSVEID
ncbi:MAG: hypothetical protein AAGA48_06800 [Myxococcota bacterium]